MNARTILILGVLTVGFGAAAMWSTREKHTAELESGYLYPGLIDKVNDVTKVEVTNKDESYTLQKTQDGWGMAERSGYEVPIDKVREITNQIAFFEILEEKTSTPALYSELSVEDVETPEAGSTRIALTAGSEVVADVLIGKAAVTNDPMAAGSLYVRKTGDQKSYEVKGRLSVSGTAVSLLDTEILKIERERVRSVVTTHPGGERLEMLKDERTDSNLTLQGIPEGREVKYDAVTDTVGSALAYLSFEDVKSAGDVDFDQPQTVTCEYETWDGLRIQVKALNDNETNDYLSLNVSYDPDLREEPATVELPEDVEAPEPPEEDPLKPAEEVQKEAEELQAHFSKWAFKVQGYRAANFRKRMEDMLKELPEEVPATTVDPIEQAVEQAVEAPTEDPGEDPEGGGH